MFFGSIHRLYQCNWCAVVFLRVLLHSDSFSDFQYEDDPDGETAAYRFTDAMLRWLMEGFHAKDKNVRSGALKAVAKMLPTLGGIEYVFSYFSWALIRKNVYAYDDSLDQFGSLEDSFTDRIQDKDVGVRESAATCLSRLLKCDSELNLEENESIDLLLESMSHDPAT